MAHEFEGVKQIDIEELKQVIMEKRNDQVVIDVREPEEYEEGHIEGVPLIPMHSIPEMAQDFDSSKEHIFVCRSGNRSHKVARYLKDQGFDKVTNFHGGMLIWDEEKKEGNEWHVHDAKELYK
ncbi:rhodanese-like domain-containing protein [Texcoconibacillus texcoconensis]|uniref:Rhodanese-related sulfurtransferase n=1 Tax=Texcoconibacillus texcoconensis TaxID=1095777 RepID=A0A840QS54_9BACI|nr:rhodanese-like domain-containing protein [Texcoconibacillus texcoconensis]MBB5174336.1 rhodanese-related sulfurtransferase [Texcoconibacillus texcoconensis]